MFRSIDLTLLGNTLDEQNTRPGHASALTCMIRLRRRFREDVLLSGCAQPRVRYSEPLPILRLIWFRYSGGVAAQLCIGVISAPWV